MKSVYVSTNLVGGLDDNLDEKEGCEIKDLNVAVFVLGSMIRGSSF